MHIKNISHRDLKPENILFSDSSKKIIKIIDFGFGKDLDAATIGFTMAGTLDYIGTINFYLCIFNKFIQLTISP